MPIKVSVRVVGYIVLLCSLGTVSLAQTVNLRDSIARHAIASIYGFHFEDYKKSVASLGTNDGDTRRLLDIFYWRWKEIPVAYSSFNQKYHELLLKNAAELDKQKSSDVPTSYLKICSYLFLAEYHSWLGENWTALKYGQKAYQYVISVIDKKYTQPEYLFITGLYKYYIEFYKQKSLFYKAALLPLRSGNKTEGLKLLRQCSETPSLAQTEARIFLSHILLHLENLPEESLPISKSLVEQYPGNLKFAELYAENLIKCKKYKEALIYVEELQNQAAPYYTGPGYFYRGCIEEDFFKNPAKAKLAYQKCVGIEYKPIEFYRKLATQRLKKL
ncbi:hypothetical protein WSM22_23740 [Cytophagales bacterium WSM2-2]|nr:hypothetical protein WSM22_23740 [Cytophagales bacterium WSM2-2]